MRSNSWKRYFAIAAFLLAFTATDAAAQIDVKPGLTAGLNLATLRGDDVENTSRSTGFHVGGMLLIDLAGPVDVQPEILYTQKGSQIEDFILDVGGGDQAVQDATFRLNYLQINGLVRYSPPTGPVRPVFFGGPYLAFELSEEIDVESGDSSVMGTSETEFFSSTDVGAVIGGGVEAALGFGTLQVDVRYVPGLTDLPEGGGSVSSDNIGISVGIVF
jgi:hypothetical protein